jgi:triacylglycerol esterase/lipase EstA (alpha/beta hydrolase family)
MIRNVSKEMETAVPDWSVFEIRLASSFDQWGFRSLEDDRVGIEDAVKFLSSKLGREKVVLMGHSTGCQVSVQRGCCVEVGSNS